MKKILWVVIGLAIIGAGWWVANTETTVPMPSSGTPLRVENLDKAPSFTLKDYDGNNVSMSDFAGKIVIVNSWAVWCPFCKKELGEFAKLQEEFPEEIVIIAIDRAESLEKAKGFSDSIGVTDSFIFLLDPEDTFYRSIGGFSMPETIFVDREGNVRIHKRGPIDLRGMRKNVLSIMELSSQ